MYRQFNFFFPIVCAIFLGSCCEPAQRNSFPQVIDTSYSDTAIKEAIDMIPPIDPLDSGFYPVYSLDIKNTGAEADTFTLSYTRNRFGNIIPLVVKQYVQSGETKTFKTLGPLPSNPLDSTKVQLFSFFVKTSDSVHVNVLQPQITIHYGQTPNGAEQCGTPGKNLSVDPTALKHK